jgi:hypothetical protein
VPVESVEAVFPAYLEAAEAACPAAVACPVAVVVYLEAEVADCQVVGEDCRAEAREAACQGHHSPSYQLVTASSRWACE